MTKRSPDCRTAKKLKKIEDERQAIKVKICQLRIEGHSLRDIGKRFGFSHQRVKDICDVLLEVETPARHRIFKGPRGGVRKQYIPPKYRFKAGFKSLLPTKKRGPAPGNTPVCDRIESVVVAMREKHPQIGAEKIGIMAKAEASAPTVRKALQRRGFPNIKQHKAKPLKRFCKPCSNDMWQIDYVDLGDNTHLLSVIDDHSRKILSKNLRRTMLTDDVLEILEETFEEYGVPRAILSDHGTQWYATRGGDSRFDEFCKTFDIVHLMGGVRKPTTQGKVERWHGNIRTETDIDNIHDFEEKKAALFRYIDFYNSVRPHYALGLQTPDRIYSKTSFPASDPLVEFGII